MAATAGDQGEVRQTTAPEGRLWALVRPATIYGTIIVSAVIVAADDNDSDLDVFLLTIASTVLIWLAHLLSEAVAGEHAVTNPPTPLRVVFRYALSSSAGLLFAAVLPLLFLLLGVFDILSESLAYFAALAAAVLSLAVLGWLVFAHRGSAWPIRLVGALATAILGAVVILLKAIAH
jgi:hypothetical protein